MGMDGMFGKNDKLFREGVTHTPAQTPADWQSEDWTLGHAGTESPAETVTPETPNFEEQIFVDPTAEFAAPTYDAPVNAAPVNAPSAPPAPAAPEAPAAEPAAPVAAAEPSQPAPEAYLSFSELMRQRSQQRAAPTPPEFAAAPAPVAEPEAPISWSLAKSATPNYTEPLAVEAPLAPQVPVTEERIAEEPAETAQTQVVQADPAPEEPAGPESLMDTAPVVEPPAESLAEAAEEPAAFIGPELDELSDAAPAAEVDGVTLYLPEEQTQLLVKLLKALESDDIRKASGKTRIQAASLQALAENILRGDQTALNELRVFGYDLTEKLADGLPPASRTLDAIVTHTQQLVSHHLVVPANAKAQQAEILNSIAPAAPSFQARLAAEQPSAPGISY